MSLNKSIENVAVVGASGRVASHFIEELLKTGKHVVTALVRDGSKGALPTGVTSVAVDFDNEESIVSALTGQQFLIITLAVTAPPDLQSKIIAAAAKAGVTYIMPNAYGYDFRNKALNADSPHGAATSQVCGEIESLGMAYVPMVCGFWYEWSLALGQPWFGIDVRTRKVTFFDDGNTKINTSTWKQCGRALAALLSLPEGGSEPSLAQWKNQPLFLSSFYITQREMLDSVQRVTGTTDKDWDIEYQPSKERFEKGRAKVSQGDRVGFVESMYARIFFPSGEGDFKTQSELSNGILGLPQDDLDEATKRAIDMAHNGFDPISIFKSS